MKQIVRKACVTAGVLLMAGYVSGQTSSPSPGWFVPVNTETGLVLSEGTQLLPCAVDINNDEYPDLVSLYIPPWGSIYTERKPMIIHLNIQHPDSSNPTARKFIDVTPQSGVHNIPGDTGFHANCYTLADFNNDGHVDLVTGNFYYNINNYQYPNDRCQIFLGDGTGKFSWKANNGLNTIGLHNVRMLTALDYDRDGNLDLFVATFYSDLAQGTRDHGYLFKGNGDGTFTDVTNTAGLANLPEAMYGSSATDWNEDCRPDIFTAPYCRSPGMVLNNNGDGTFTNVAGDIGYNLERTGAGQRSCTFSIIPEDVNNDGYMDLFFTVVHGGNAPGQFRSTIGFNKGPAHNYSFDVQEDLLPVDAPASSHRGDYDGSFLDFDNDGLKDLVMVQGTYMPATDHTYFWQQQPDHTFLDVTAEMGLLVPSLKSTGAIDVIDYDLDGDDDLLIAQASGGVLELWKNTVGQDKSHIAVRVRPMPGNPINGSGIGTRIYVYYEGKMQMREVMAGRGQHTGQQPFLMNFGLGNATSVDSVVIRWPDANCSRKLVRNPPINSRVIINSFPAGVEEKEQEVMLKVFPNPTNRYLVVQGNTLTDRVEGVFLTDAAGRRLPCRPSTSDGDKFIFDLQAVPQGIYFLTITYRNAQTSVHKIFKN